MRTAGQLLVDHFQRSRTDTNECFVLASCGGSEVLESRRLPKLVQNCGLHASSLGECLRATLNQHFNY
jgi:hypothetical protein